MVSLSDVRRWEPDALEKVFAALGKHKDRLVGLDDELEGSARPEGWRGQAADAAAQSHAGLTRVMRELVVEVAGVRRAVAETTDEVEAIRRLLRESDDLAEGHGFEITAEGGVRDVAPPDDVPEDQVEQVKQERIRIRDQIVENIRTVLQRANRADDELAKVLADADRNLMDPGRGGSLADDAATGDSRGLAATIDAPRNGTPEENAKWWKSLSPEEQEALRKAPPAWLGNRDGIPAQVRDVANRNRIDDEREALNAEKAEIERGGVSDDERKRLEEVTHKIESIGAVEKTLERQPSRQLLVLDSSGERLKAAVAVGDVDTADHVSVFTPGLNSTVNGTLEGLDHQMNQLRAQSQHESDRHGEGGQVAAISWIGYETPQDHEHAPWHENSVTRSDAAENGGAKLNEFFKGINASRDTDPHLTALGHSYGSTTTGYALQGGGHGVDDAIVFGSPGVGTDDVEDLHVPEGHTYRIEARNDPVADFGRFGGDPTHMEGVQDLSAKESTEPDGRQKLSESTGHNGYVADDSTSQHNMAAVVAGLPDRTVRGEGRGVGDYISWAPSKIRDLF
ncbi:alpha/beta hydrolase family protein [Saccharopolyspora erythraea NRRL 2338]|uniref:DUF1023 domain-containing protein n=2 Tax=Saccharopolyspora erythraea TaxID=1836 RepID=A4F8H3_SACEN|nr:alpha/beta hydrolase [Saccharopolyspora erythraea]EQD82331.1 hypothetical protein N599_31220 [Saccharopolyspora erythraea D]PFG94142.1 alpha/beta hydrolase family protein [Saccharopolyspora erythraea NRRL 2338]QRK90931.1 hypothetical protein JQX30_05595 [Saccharopolyspora erythraea]CAM00348.1 hypothetical protein SACE_1016 [Saccharopolyspora erythraea NRRL 2338]